jgi:uncharacterized protein
MSATLTVAIDRLEVPLGRLREREPVGIDHHLQPYIAKACRVAAEDILSYRIERRSLDARHKPDLRFVYHLVATLRDGAPVAAIPGIAVLDGPPPQDDQLWHLRLRDPPPRDVLVVGSGPAGLMCAYLLAVHGCRPIVLDRGRDVDRRGADIERMHTQRQIDPDSNYLFGEGGAGTYSDGKLYTRVKDRRMRFLLEAFVAARAPRHILFRHHPHIGSDILPHMCKRLRQMIIAKGGVFRWDSEVVDVIEGEGRCTGVVLRSGERLTAPVTVIAPGHSARQLITAVARRGVAHKAKGFQLGCRIEHDQRVIDLGQYGCIAGTDYPRHLLHAAEYNLVSRPPEHLGSQSVTTFCMCPGGEIIAATSDPGQLSTNGMSRYARASGFANAGLIVNQPDNHRDSPLAGFDVIDRLEQACYAAGGSDYACPAQSATAFARGEAGAAPTTTSYRFGLRPGRLDRLLPPATVKAISAALVYFERLIPGFMAHGTLIGVEARVSSPLRFERNPDTLESSLPGLYLAGEGAGYAGGIVSAGLDGLRIAETLLTGIAAKRER